VRGTHALKHEHSSGSSVNTAGRHGFFFYRSA
jgi:hypothetical protein